MMRFGLKTCVVASFMLLSACDVATDAADNAVRQTAEGVITTVVEDQFPGVDAAPLANCVVDNAETSEIVSLAKAAVTGVTADDVSTVLNIAQRSGTLNCIASNGLGLLSL